jgi:hypothetical protein
LQLGQVISAAISNLFSNFKNKHKKAIVRLLLLSAAKEIRTPIPLPELPPQGSASTSFAIAAKKLQNYKFLPYYFYLFSSIQKVVPWPITEFFI